MLCGYDCTWVQTWEDRIPVGAFPGGYSENHHETLYIGRVEHEGHLIPGKVQPSHKVCYFSFEGREIGKKSYEILIDPNITVKSANNNHMSVDVDSASESDQDDNYGYNSPDIDEDSDAYYDEEDNPCIF